MRAKLYCDTVTDAPLLAIQEETLTDGSKVFNLNWNGHIIPCIDEASADKAFYEIADALKICTAENVVTY